MPVVAGTKSTSTSTGIISTTRRKCTPTSIRRILFTVAVSLVGLNAVILTLWAGHIATNAAMLSSDAATQAETESLFSSYIYLYFYNSTSTISGSSSVEVEASTAATTRTALSTDDVGSVSSPLASTDKSTDSGVTVTTRSATDSESLTNNNIRSSEGEVTITDCTTGNATLDQIQVPTFILAGAQKAGTSALFQLLNLHPDILSSRRHEAHFFDQMAKVRTSDNAAIATATTTSGKICTLRELYRNEFDLESVVERTIRKKKKKKASVVPSMITFEKSPAYLCKPRVPAHIKKVVPWIKILLILRNPIDRAFSNWKMARQNQAYTDSFETAITREVLALHQLDLSTAPELRTFLKDPPAGVNNSHFNIPINQTLHVRGCRDDIGAKRYKTRERRRLMCGYLSRGMYAQQVTNWLASFELGVNLKIVRYERFLENRTAVLQEILDYVGADSGMLQLDDKILEYDFSPGGRQTMQTKKEKMEPEVRDYLSRFYKPYNDELADLLGEEWQNVWE